jgi:peroxiredoxin family protein
VLSFAVVLYSDERGRFYDAAAFLAGAAARGRTGLLFLRGPALKAYITQCWSAHPPELADSLRRFENPSSQDLLDLLREKGKVRLYACSAWVRILGLPPEEVASRVDAVAGLPAFLSQSDGAPVLYI